MSKIEKAKSKQHYYNRKPNSKKSSLDVNLKGFLCSCNNREKDCIRESYNILNKYADILWPPKTDEEPEEKKDVEDELQKELAELKSTGKDKKKFQVLDSGAKNFLFIRTTLEDPVALAQSIVCTVAETKIQETKFLLRIVPVEITCKAYVDDIEKAFTPLAERYFKDSPKNFSVVYNHRNNNSLSRDEVIKKVADVVFKTREDHKVNLKDAEVSIIIEVIKGFALIGVVPNFIKYKKYNLLMLSEQDTKEEEVVRDDSDKETDL